MAWSSQLAAQSASTAPTPPAATSAPATSATAGPPPAAPAPTTPTATPPAPTTSSAPAGPPPAAPAHGVGAPTSLIPFGRGALVEFRSEGDPVQVFIARADAGDELATDFKRIGRTPFTIELPSGRYRIEAEGFDISNGGMWFQMGEKPRRIAVRPGKEGLSLLGGLSLAIGITAVAGATVVLASGSKAPSSLDKPAILIPAYATGAVLIGAGIGLNIAATTHVEETRGAQASANFRFVF